MAIGLKTAAGGLTIPSGTDIVQTSGYSVAGDGGHALYIEDTSLNDAAVAALPRARFKSANGRYFRLSDSQQLNVRMFGMSPPASAATNNSAFQAAVDYREATAANGSANGYGFAQGVGAGRLFIPRGLYNLSAVIEIRATVIIEGEGGTDTGAGATILKWAAGTSGFRVQRYNTSGESTVDGVTHNGGDGSIFRNLWLEGGYTNVGGTEGEYHAIHAKARILCENVVTRLWQGDGFHLHAVSGGGTYEGNANLSRFYNCLAVYCRDGLFLDGDNTNACLSMGFNATACRRWGINDGSFLANQHLAFHLDGNGQTFGSFSAASYSGKIYYCLIGQETWCSTNAPSGTTASNQGWIYHATGGVGAYASIAWTSGLTWRAGGPILTDNSNAPHVVSGYCEGGQFAAMLQYPTMMLGNGFYNAISEYGTNTPYSGIIGATSTGNAPKGIKIPGGLTADIVQILGGSASASSASGPVIFLDADKGLSYWPKGGGTSYDQMFYDASGNQVAGNPHGSRDWELAAGDFKVATGKGLKVAGNRVVTDRQTGTPADATDLATALTLVNALKAKLITHGLIS